MFSESLIDARTNKVDSQLKRKKERERVKGKQGNGRNKQGNKSHTNNLKTLLVGIQIEHVDCLAGLNCLCNRNVDLRSGGRAAS